MTRQWYWASSVILQSHNLSLGGTWLLWLGGASLLVWFVRSGGWREWNWIAKMLHLQTSRFSRKHSIVSWWWWWLWLCPFCGKARHRDAGKRHRQRSLIGARVARVRHWLELIFPFVLNTEIYNCEVFLWTVVNMILCRIRRHEGPLLSRWHDRIHWHWGRVCEFLKNYAPAPCKL